MLVARHFLACSMRWRKSAPGSRPYCADPACCVAASRPKSRANDSALRAIRQPELLLCRLPRLRLALLFWEAAALGIGQIIG